MQLNPFIIRPIVEAALREEIGPGDTTGGFLVGPGDTASCQIYLKERAVVAGLPVAEQVFKTLEPDCTVVHAVQDGDEVPKGTVLMRITAPCWVLFASERVSLDYIQYMSGIATKTRRYVRLVEPYNVRITDTRKGVPGCRVLQKYAVRVGGAHNHLYGLHNCILVKDNHIKAAGSVTRAVEILKARAQHTFKIEVECESLQMIKDALAAGADVIMLDNMTMDEMREAVAFIGKRVPVEASGGIRESNIVEIAKLGVDVISVGDLTRNVQTVDVSLDVGEIKASALRQMRLGQDH
ncbi:MAG: carboxylating nicotinate-nucleotide diphosphorylase [Candidatus Rokubacteria bacterium]|nr:carboxylating nicotinate-nucleotide diphosphorylase [Candidatus Rokubacteria bacterium]